MLKIELDHIFIFTESPEQAASSLRQFGLTEGMPNTHLGQGTSCRRFYFENAYLELAWVSNEAEIKNPAIAETKLWERSQYQFTHYCPFGLCFRNTKINAPSFALIFEDGWPYKPFFMPEGTYANIAANTHLPTEPMLFEMPFFGLTPLYYPPEKQQPLNHQKGFKEITKVILTLPVTADTLSTALQKVVQSSIVAIAAGNNFSVVLEFDNGKTRAMQAFSPLIPLTIRW